MSSSVAAEAQGRVAQKSLSTGMTLLLATACGLTAANIYYAQPLIGLIAPDIGLGETAANLSSPSLRSAIASGSSSSCRSAISSRIAA